MAGKGETGLMEEKKTLILGAAGFIGTNLSRRLLEKGKRLLLFDRPGVSFAPFLQRAQEDKAAQILSGSFSSLAKEKTCLLYTSRCV